MEEIMRELAGDSKRFIMFDKSGDTGRILFTPNHFYELPNVTDDHEAGNFYREAMASFSAMQRSRPYSVTLFDMNTNVSASDEGSSKVSYEDFEENNESTSAHEEDSEDIDALLYSDDEYDEVCSTGHSPSDVTSEDNESDEITSGFNGESESSSGFKGESESDENSEEVTRKKNKLTSVRREIKKRQRKDKIRQTVRMLQSIIPGADSLDRTVVLDEAINYMKVLQMKVLELEANRQVKI